MSDKLTTTEKWIRVEGWDRYEVSNFGRIRNSSTMRCLRPAIRSRYLYVVLCGPNKSRHKSASVHRLVAIHHCQNPNGLNDVNHKDGDKLNNAASNLEWVSRKQNTQHAYAIGLLKKGEESPVSKLNESEVRSIREIYSKQNISQRKLGILFGIAQTTVGKIVNMKKWRHVA